MIPRIFVHLLYITVFILCAIGLRKLSQVLNVEHNTHADEEFTAYDPKLIITDQMQHLHWFVQISDLHISKFHSPSRVKDLEDFCRTSIDIIQPPVVLASGDLTDAKVPLSFWSQQYQEEWEEYRSTLERSGVLKKTKWLDVRGNHDTFDVSSIHNAKNYFRKYGVQGKDNPKNYMHIYKSGSDSVAFVAVDTCLEPGPRWPFNFFGKLDAEEMDALKELSEKSRSSNFTIFWGHHPTSCTLSPHPGISSVMSHGLAYLCGHLHTLGHMVYEMYAMQSTGSLELELEDWKHNRKYRIFAIDHGLFSFVDLKYNRWPAVIVTNPKNALYQMPAKEPLQRMTTSTHIRILAFSASPIEKILVRFPGEGSTWHTCHHQEGPLYTLPWNPERFSTGIHTLDVHVVDSSGQQTSITHEFSLDGTKLSFKLLPKVILLGNLVIVLQTFYLLVLMVCLVPLLVFRWWHGVIRRRGGKAPQLWPSFRKMWIMSTVDRMFYPIVFYTIYLSLGPWFVGEMIEGYMGVVFLWGSFVGSHFMPGSLTYFYGIMQLCLFVLPLTMGLSHRVHERFRSQSANRSSFRSHLPLFLVCLSQVLSVFYFYSAYRTIFFLLGSIVMWSLMVAVLLWREAASLPAHCLRNAAMVWNLVPAQAEEHKIS